MHKHRFLRRRNDWAADDARAAPPTPAQPCRRCARLRIFVAGVLLAAGFIILHAAAQGPAGSASAPTSSAATAHPVPPRPEPQATPLPSTPVAQSTASAPASTLTLIYQTVPLPSGRLNQPYKPRDLVRGGHGPYRFDLDGKLPPGLSLDAAGRLTGTPTTSGSYRFQLTVADASNPPHVDQAPYVLQVLDPVTPPAKAASSAGKGRGGRPITDVTLDQAGRSFEADPPLPMTYVLTQAKLDQLFGDAEAQLAETQAQAAGQASADGAAVATKPPVGVMVLGPTLEQLREMLLPLKDIEHPTRAVFQDSLRARQCDYFLRHVNALALEEHKDLLARCPRKEDLVDKDGGPTPRPGASRATAPSSSAASAAAVAKPTPAEKALQAALASGRLPLATFLDLLMPVEKRDEITELAGVTHAIANAKPLQLVPEGCGCTLPDAENDVFAFLPYWMNDADPTNPMPVRFDKFTRLQYMGAILRNDGNFLLPNGWDSAGGGFARQVDKHAVNLDLVLYRRDFRALSQLSGKALDTVLDTATSHVHDMLERRHGDLQGALETVLPLGWREASYVYDGVTVFFDTTDEEAQSEGFERFYMGLVLRLVKLMEEQPNRHFHLNLVVPQHLLGEPETAFRFKNLMHIMKSAEKRRVVGGNLDPKDRGAAAATYKSKADYEGKGDISVRFLVPLGAGSDTGKMQLRSRTDFNDELVGEDRMALLGSLVPALLHAGGPPQEMPPNDADALDRDLVYIGWSFGGIAFWPLPVGSRGTGSSVLTGLDARFWSYLGQDTAFCKFVCPLRLPFRLALEALLLATGSALLAYGWNCRVRRLGKLYLMGLWAGGIATLAVACAVFTCDPSLNELRKGNVPLLMLILLLVVVGLVFTFKPRVEDP